MKNDYENIRSAVERFDFDSLLGVFAQYGLGGDGAIVAYSEQQRSIIHFTLLCVADKLSRSPVEDSKVNLYAHDFDPVFLRRLLKKIPKVIDFSGFMSEITCFLSGGMAVEERRFTEIKDSIVCSLDDGKFTDKTGSAIAAHCIIFGSADAVMVFWQLVEDGELQITPDDYFDIFAVLLTTVELKQSFVLTVLYGNLLPAVDNSGVADEAGDEAAGDGSFGACTKVGRKQVIRDLLFGGFFGSPIAPY